MTHFTVLTAIITILIVLSIGFVLVAPTGIIARAFNAIGGAIQTVTTKIKKLW